MKPRKFKHRIEVWKTVPTADGFGGNVVDDVTPNETLLGSSWCKVTTIAQNKFVDFGLDEVRKAIKVNVRKRNDLDYEQEGLFFKYKDVRYTVNGVTEYNIDGYHYQIIASA